MNSQELRNLQEAYLEVYQELDEASGGIIGGRNFPSGSVPLKQKPKSSSGIARIVRKSLSSANFSLSSETPKDIVNRNKKHSNHTLNILSRRSDEKEPGKGRSKSPRELQLKVIEREKRRRGIQQEQVDLYDLILSHLLDEGYADTQEGAEVIMVNMSEEWRESITETYKKLPLGKMMRKVQKRATREADTRAEVDFDRYPTTQVVKAAQRAARDDARSDTMINVADTHNEKQAKRKEDDNRREGGRKRDAGRPRSNELQDNW